jgi:peroxiredoxin
MSKRAREETIQAAGAGFTIPDDIELDYGFPPKKINLAKFCESKKVLLVGLPGAFTPT